MNNGMQVFENGDFGKVRVVERDGEPWFVGKDIALALGYSNPQKAIRDHVDDEDRTVNESFTVHGTPAILINESGLYSLVMGSKLPNAKAFKRWVTCEVVPSIRKHGAYITPDKIEEILINPDTIIRLCTDLKEERAKRVALEVKVDADAPKVLFAGAVETSQDSCLVGQLAKMIRQNGYEIGQNRLFDYLRNEGYLCKSGSNRNMPTQRSMEAGLFEVKESVVDNPDGSVRLVRTTKVTGKGQIYFVNKFLSGKAS
jgi:anti-repressor protein